MEKEQRDKIAKQKATLGTPKNLMIPILLLHLREMNAHGYELMERLTQFGVPTLDQGNFYRLLRQLEKDAFVTSEWDVSASGPAKRIYALTEAGEEYLNIWAQSLTQYQHMLQQFFSLYNPFFSFPTASKKSSQPVKKDDMQ